MDVHTMPTARYIGDMTQNYVTKQHTSANCRLTIAAKRNKLPITFKLQSKLQSKCKNQVQKNHFQGEQLCLQCLHCLTQECTPTTSYNGSKTRQKLHLQTALPTQRMANGPVSNTASGNSWTQMKSATRNIKLTSNPTANNNASQLD